jgi:hypothetical protein
MRSVTAVACATAGFSRRGNRSGGAQRSVTRWGRILHPRLTASVPNTATGTTTRAGLQREPPDAASRAAERPWAHARPLREDHHAVAALEDQPRGVDRRLITTAAVDRERAEPIEQPARDRVREQLLLGDVVDRPPRQRADHEGIQEAAVVRGEDHRPASRHMLHAQSPHPEVHEEARLQQRADKPVHDPVHAACPMRTSDTRPRRTPRAPIHGFPRGVTTSSLSAISPE